METLVWNTEMLVSAIILVTPFVAIFTEGIYGVHRVKCGMGGNGTHLGSTANVFIVTISEQMAKDAGDPSLAIAPVLWFRKGLPVRLVTLCTCTIIMYFFFDFFAVPLR